MHTVGAKRLYKYDEYCSLEVSCPVTQKMLSRKVIVAKIYMMSTVVKSFQLSAQIQ